MEDTRQTSLRGPTLAAETCLRRLSRVLKSPADSLPVSWDVSWHGPASGLGGRGSEATVQARAGLMEVHGWDTGRPRRLGLEVASVAAGVLAANGVLAALVGGRRDRPLAGVQTSVLQGGLLLVAHHIAAATSGGELLPSPAGPEPGPPFRSAGGEWFEIEVFEPEAWKEFWLRLGAGDADLGRAWTAFRSRYYRGRCSLPSGLHQATARHTLAQLSELAGACQISLARLRGYAEVLARPDFAAPDPGLHDLPVVGPTGGAVGNGGRGELPLAGLRVVEATNRMQGPLAGLLLQMLGAEVIRVEPPGGDVGRLVPPACGEVGSFFLCFNRGKRSVELDLTHPRGQGELLALLGESDVFLHNWRPGRATLWGLDQAGTTAANPRLVYAEASGWDAASENARLIGTDFLVQAHSAFGEGLNPVGEAPLTSRVLLTDCLGALVTCEGVLAGLYAREVTGHPTAVATSLLQGAMAAQAHVLEAMTDGRADGRRAGRPVWGPLDRPIEAEGGWVMVSIEDDSDYQRLCELCGILGSSGSRATVDAELAACIARMPPHHWEKQLEDADIPCATAALNLAAFPADSTLAPVLEALGGSCYAPASPWTFSP